MIAYKGLLASVLALSVSFVYGTPTARHNRPLLRARQAADLPSQCTSQCGPLSQALNTCAPSGDLSQLDLTCFCTPAITSSVDTCASCVSQADPSEASFTQQLESEVANACSTSISSAGGDDSSSSSNESDFSTSDSFDPSSSDESDFSTSDSFDPTSSGDDFGPTPSGEAGGSRPTGSSGPTGSTGSSSGGAGSKGPVIKTNAGSQLPLGLPSIITLCFLQVYALT